VHALVDSLRKSGLSRELIYATALWERGAELPTAFLDVCQRLAQTGSSTFLASNVDKTRSASPRSCHSILPSRSVTRRSTAGERTCREKSDGETQS
jgi:hypothetical protein